MQDYKVNPNCRIREYAAWLSQLNNFVWFMPSEKALFAEMDLQEVLNGTLPKTYQKILTSIKWNIYKNATMKL